MNKTKIIATVGPATACKEMIRQLILNGVDTIRINMSHSDDDFCRNIVRIINELNIELNTYVAVMIDIKGPIVRIGKVQNNHAFLKKGDKIRIFMEDILGDCTKFSVDYPNLIKDVPLNTTLKIDDGLVELRVLDKGSNYLLCEVLKEGNIASHKTMNVLNIKLNRPFLSEKDKQVIKLAHELNADFLALSFVSSSEDVLEVNDLLINMGNDHLQIISKIENNYAVADIDNIIKVSDGIMVARGDLGAEIPLERIPGIQKKIISKCHARGVISIVATELLSNMTNLDHPTRAEVSDIANAVLDGTDAVMLSGETTVGKYPVEALNMMERIIKAAEKDIDYNSVLQKSIQTEKRDVTGTLAYSVAGCALNLQCKAIFTPTMSGYTAKKISRFHPICPIVAPSPNIATVKSLALNFGVYPVLIDDLKSLDAIVLKSKKLAQEMLGLTTKDNIIITGGYPFKKVKTTNFMKIEEM